MNKDVSIQVDLSDMKKLQKLPSQVNTLVQKAFVDVMDLVYQQSQQLVPVDTGALRASAQFTHSVLGSMEKPQAAIEYGGGAVYYAVYVHEDLQARHKAPTQAKFLEAPFTNSLPLLQRVLQTRLTELMNRQ